MTTPRAPPQLQTETLRHYVIVNNKHDVTTRTCCGLHERFEEEWVLGGTLCDKEDAGRNV